MTVKAKLDTTSPFGSRSARVLDQLIWRICDLRVLSTKIRRFLRKRFARKIVGPFDMVHDGTKFRLYPAENYCDRVLFGRHILPEWEEHEVLLPLLSSGMVFVDIGANIGTYCAFVGTRVHGEVTLLGLEPHPRTYQKLLYNLQANGLSVHSILNCGVGEERGELDLWSDGGSNIGHTSMLKAGTSNPKISVKVPVVPLLDILVEQNISRIDLLKIDIEGYEDRALGPFIRGAVDELLPTHILIEVVHQHLWQVNLLNQMTDRGYLETFRTEENILFSRSLDTILPGKE